MHPHICFIILQKSVEELPSPGWKAGCQGCKGEISCQLTAGDMADDEREDSSETEPEPDYDEDEAEDGGSVKCYLH